MGYFTLGRLSVRLKGIKTNKLFHNDTCVGSTKPTGSE